MTTFTGGPADGRALLIKRVPMFLRVVRDKKGNRDALDQLADQPRIDETIAVYRRVTAEGFCCIRAAKGRGCYPLARYEHVADRPDEATLRSTRAWRAWALAQAAAPPKK